MIWREVTPILLVRLIVVDNRPTAGRSDPLSNSQCKKQRLKISLPLFTIFRILSASMRSAPTPAPASRAHAPDMTSSSFDLTVESMNLMLSSTLFPHFACAHLRNV
ncbi:hypothetical protein T10_5867 [Trichinella papuae]|uniref:Uncharacterized protein n=1 Tax=Trichinella papuae TaxID=268474 RepID=A0A0V1ME96_9BILA|nr:hypothetical protein T10_5867 [Trichinella papuae]